MVMILTCIGNRMRRVKLSFSFMHAHETLKTQLRLNLILPGANTITFYSYTC